MKITNIDFVNSKILSEGFIYMQVKDSAGRIAGDCDPDDTSGRETVAYLQDILDNTDGLINITLYNRNRTERSKGGSLKGVLNYEYLATSGDTSKVGSHGSINPQMPSQGHIDEIKAHYDTKMQAVEEKYENKLAIMKLNNRFDEQQNGDRMAELTYTIVEGIAGKLFSFKQGPISGINNTDSNETEEQVVTDQSDEDRDRIRINQAIHFLYENDKNFTNHLTALANLLQESPKMYETAVKQLMILQ